MKLPLISIVVPIYNVEKYLDECIQSIINQTYKNLEVLLINDGSTDSSLDICKKYKEDKRIIIINKKNEGLSQTRQTGIDLLSGKYFCTIDPDDYINSEYIAVMYNKIIQTEADICVCSRVDFSNNHNRKILLDVSTDFVKQLKKADIENSYIYYSKKIVLSDSWNKMYQTEFIKKTNIRFTLDNKYNGTDLLFNHLLLLHCPKITTVNDILYNHRIVEGSRVHRKNKEMQQGFFIIIEAIAEEARKLDFDEQIKIQVSLLYIELQKLAASDLYYESETRKIKRSKYYMFIEKFKEFYEENLYINLKEVHFKKFTNKLFLLFIKYNFADGFILYYDLFYLLKVINKPIKNIKYKVNT
ncbi:glycosyltransferase family 2 protein [Carnobacterium sp. CS13]|uniref:glycosyltransferase family 2 protein n=1 Tax=Carnobacterium sp. CS13 TaxID=2800128 RepID=UPI0019116EC2|nr:glycosyltransferase family 2 protein [Carnobacterium sp. CS13]QQP69547.1 glycosyltransferase family 2 protein [Carnobacterium sp. CS13]